MKIIGIHDGHNASACLFEDGVIIGALQEERLRREKNWAGPPSQTIQWLLKEFSIHPSEVDCVALNGNHMARPIKSRQALLDLYRSADKASGKVISLARKTFIYDYYRNRRQKERISEISELGFRPGNIRFVEHHLCHAAAAYFGYAHFNEPILIVTCDGAGDGLCATISVGENGKIKRLASVGEDESIGNLYAVVTFMMGMVPLEHEYKIMGMAPYADQKGAKRVRDILLLHFEFTGNGLTWRRCNGMPETYNSYAYLRKLFEFQRFDAVMGGLQLFAEEMLSRWVSNAIRETGIRKVVMSGGVFMNVKANKVIMELPEVDDLFIFPSCGDETNAMGACFYVFAKESGTQHFKKLGPIYWGPEYSNDEVKAAIEAAKTDNKISFEYHEDIEKIVASLLAAGKIVARFAGREELGARSLGNRAILADASKTEVIKKINSIIKNRDFWMPFACSILDESEKDYLINPKCIQAPYMILTFNTIANAQKDLAAGMHPYDATVRPQIVSAGHNPAYHKLISEYKRLTGRGGVLNTSLNLHGFPIVSHPADALEVLDKSGLEYLAIENFLVKKTL